ncbi:MAG TPA: matrixin family metalloprotease, partial [Chroococcales cyanobacterium]
YFENIVSEGSYRWPEEKIPLKVFVEDGRDVKGYKDSFRADLIKSFNSWCEASDGRLCYRIVIDRRHADIDCGWTANPTEVAGDGRVSERGSAKLTARAGIIQNATLKILTRPILENGILSDDDMTKACLHEVGHVLGLQGHSTNNHDVMFYTVDTATVWPVLSRRDKRTIARLYEKYRRSPSNAVR